MIIYYNIEYTNEKEGIMMKIPYQDIISAKMDMEELLKDPKSNAISKMASKILWNLTARHVKKLIYRSRDKDTIITKYDLIAFFEFVIATNWENDIVRVRKIANRYSAEFKDGNIIYIIDTHGSVESSFYFTIQSERGEIRSEFVDINSASPAGSCVYKLLTDYVLDYLRIEENDDKKK